MGFGELPEGAIVDYAVSTVRGRVKRVWFIRLGKHGACKVISARDAQPAIEALQARFPQVRGITIMGSVQGGEAKAIRIRRALASRGHFLTRIRLYGVTPSSLRIINRIIKGG